MTDTTTTETEQIRPDDGTNEEVATDVAITGFGNSEDESRSSDNSQNSANPDEGQDLDLSDEPETFPRDYVEKLRKENAGYREKAKKAEQWAHELHAARVASTGRLADPSDLPFDESHLEDLPRLEAAIDELLQSKPHLASRKPRGEIGQGLTSGSGNVDLAGILRSRV